MPDAATRMAARVICWGVVPAATTAAVLAWAALDWAAFSYRLIRSTRNYTQEKLTWL